jgi:hypothetical protein
MYNVEVENITPHSGESPDQESPDVTQHLKADSSEQMATRAEGEERGQA